MVTVRCVRAQCGARIDVKGGPSPSGMTGGIPTLGAGEDGWTHP